MKVFRWKNCYADVATSQHGVTVQSFFDDVIVPAIRALEKKIAALGLSDNPGDTFAHADMEDVLQETKMAFGLSIQSIWERQLRGYLRGCAEELRPRDGLAAQVAKGSWEKLCALFLELRGIRFDAFPSFAELEHSHLLGNVCRHGDGPSAVELAKRCPELWRVCPPMPSRISRSIPGRDRRADGRSRRTAPGVRRGGRHLLGRCGVYLQREHRAEASEPRGQARAGTLTAELAAAGRAQRLRLAMAADQQLLDALATLWRIPRPGPDNLLSAPAFVTLSELCDRRYGRGKATFALSSALRSLGLPCGLPPDQSSSRSTADGRGRARRSLHARDDGAPAHLSARSGRRFAADDVRRRASRPVHRRGIGEAVRCAEARAQLPGAAARVQAPCSVPLAGGRGRCRGRSDDPRRARPRLCSWMCAETSARSNPISAGSRRPLKARSFSCC